jgi:hypothetical protein
MGSGEMAGHAARIPLPRQCQQDFDYALELAAMRIDDRRTFQSDDLDFIMGTKMAALYRVRSRERSHEPLTAQLN